MPTAQQQSNRDCATFELCGAIEYLIEAKLVPDDFAAMLKADVDRVRSAFGLRAKYSNQVAA